MPIDAAKALAAEPRAVPLSWDHKDVLLYHLGVGAGVPATDPAELRYVLEDRLHVLPSFATVAGGGMIAAGWPDTPGIDVDLAAVLHGGQAITLHRPIPVRGEGVTQTSRIAAVLDKGKAAVIVLRTDVADADGPLWSGESRLFVRGEGGFGGERGGGGERPEPPGRAPDATVERPVREDQALLYRLSGDRNPLHADPAFAARAGFERPILHGLCTYGMALKAVVDTLLAGEPARVRSYATRFSGVVLPGETLRVRMWRDAPEPGRIQVSVTAGDDRSVLSDTVVGHD